MSSLPASAQVASSPSEDAQPGGRPARGSAAHRPKPGRKVYLDCINVLAIIGVVALHNRFNYRVDYDSPGWVLENILSGTAVAAVPLFFMASGITLLNFTERESVGTFYKKRFTKILVPLLIWGQIYLFARSWFTHTPLPKGEEILAVLLAPSTVGVTLWYLEALIGVYLVLPIFSYALRGAGEKKVHLAWLMAVLGLFMPIATTTVHKINPHIMPEFTAPIVGYVGFCFLGYALANTSFSLPWRLVIYVLGVAGSLTHILYGPYLTLNHHGLESLAMSYLSIPTIFWASAVFVFFKSLPLNRLPQAAQTGLRKLSALTFGVYLIHLLIIQGLAAYGWPLVDYRLEAPYALMVWASSLILVWLLRWIPPVRKWLVP